MLTQKITSEFSSEDQLQYACFNWFHNTFHEHRQMLFHVNNKAKNRIEGVHMKSMGVVKGISDLIFISTSGVVYFLELKLPGKTQSEEQITFQQKVTVRGLHYEIITNLEQFKQFIWARLQTGIRE